MQSLVLENIFEEVNVTDYQSVCYMYTNEGNPANILQTVCIWFDKIRGENSGSIEMWFIDLSLQPFLYIWKLIKLTIKLIAWAIIQTSLLPVDANDVTPEYDGIFKLRKYLLTIFISVIVLIFLISVCHFQQIINHQRCHHSRSVTRKSKHWISLP